MYDLIIKNGKIINGTGSPSFYSDIAITDGKIVSIRRGLEGAKEVIDATGLTVTPGFIDSHSHSDATALLYPDQIEKIEQGITTSISGQCGETLAPVSRDVTPETDVQVGEFGSQLEVYKTMGTFLDILENVPQGSNIATFVGHSAIRKAVMGFENREPSAEEMEKMKAFIRDGMEHGALGLSFGLFYPPSCYSKTEELIELAKVVAEYNGLIVAHMRNESLTVVKATEEFLSVAKATGVRAIVSHHKSSGKENWGKITHTLRMIDEANDSGTDVYCDVYPYVASNSSISSCFVPIEYHAAGPDGMAEILYSEEGRKKTREYIFNKFGNDLSWAMITIFPPQPEYEGLTIPQIAEIRGTDVFDTVCDLVAESKNICNACFFTMCEEDVETIMKHPRAMICTDSAVAADAQVYHPRLRGSFPRVLGRYVRERGVTPLYEMIRKITSMPASVYGLKTKGLLWEGMDADICIFDEEKIIDNAGFVECHKRADGLNYVILGGEVVVENAVYNGKRKGRLIKYNE